MNGLGEELKLSENNNNVLLNLIDYIKSNNINVLFVIPKRCFPVESQKKLNYAVSIIKENGLEVINSNTLEDLNIIDFKENLYNPNHLNVFGATKYTLYFSKYLKENYDLEDHRNTNTDPSWNTEYERFKQTFNTLTDQNFNDILTILKNIYPDLF